MSEQAEHSTGGVYSSKGKEYSRDTRYIPTRIKREVEPGGTPCRSSRGGTG